MSASDDLLEAAKQLLENARDTGECFVRDWELGDDNPVDEEGNRWYHDWFYLKEAVESCEEEKAQAGPR